MWCRSTLNSVFDSQNQKATRILISSLLIITEILIEYNIFFKGINKLIEFLKKQKVKLNQKIEGYRKKFKINANKNSHKKKPRSSNNGSTKKKRFFSSRGNLEIKTENDYSNENLMEEKCFSFF